MARVVVTFATIGSTASDRSPAPALQLGTEATEMLTVGSTSVVSVNKAPAAKRGRQGFSDGVFASVTALDGNVWIAGGSAPVAVVAGAAAGGKGFPLLAGQSRDFAVAPDDRIAAITLPSA